MFFALAIQPLLLQLHESITDHGLQLAYSFLDDLSLAGEQQAVAGAFHFFERAALRIGLKFNTAKCEIIPTAGHRANLNKSLFPNNMILREDGNFELLGGPIGSDEYCNQHMQERVERPWRFSLP